MVREFWSRRCRVALVAAALAMWLGTVPAAAETPHQIRSGETLSEIAAAYGIPVEELASINQIADVNLIFAGDTLLIPGINPSTGASVSHEPSTSAASNYQVQAGDTLWTIARIHDITVDALMSANPEIADPNTIFVNQSLRLPIQRAPGTTAPLVATVARSNDASIPTLLTQIANAYGVDSILVQAIAWQESGWQQHVVSSAGAMGVMQIMPATGNWVASDIVGRPLDVGGSPADNITAGVAYLRWLIDRTDSIELALAGYYQGPGNLQRYGVLPESQQYINNVLYIRSHLMLYGTPPGR